MDTSSDLRDSTSLTFNRFRSTKGPIIDIRSENEFAQGHWPGSKNLPLLRNEERELVGITYKEKGRDLAIKLGLKLITPKLPEIKKALEEIDQIHTKYNHKTNIIKIYCWRGGLRSKAFVWYANLLGFKTIQLRNGYKAYRKWALDQFKKEWSLIVIGGRTGTGKTDLLQTLNKLNINIIDLEELAKHRGSSFGSIGLAKQPSTEQFENLIAESLNKFKKNSFKQIWIEDENPNLGKCRVPVDLYKKMQTAPLIEIVRTENERVTRLIELYGKLPKKYLKEATIRINKRLGSERTKLAVKAIEEEKWREACLTMLHYYDKCYDFQLKKTKPSTSIDISGLNNEEAARRILNLKEIGMV